MIDITPSTATAPGSYLVIFLHVIMTDKTEIAPYEGNRKNYNFTKKTINLCSDSSLHSSMGNSMTNYEGNGDQMDMEPASIHNAKMLLEMANKTNSVERGR